MSGLLTRALWLSVGLTMGVVRPGILPPSALAAQPEQGVVRSQFVWFDRAGQRLATLGGLADYANFELSPDGGRVAAAVLDSAARTHDIWVYEVASGRRTRFTSDPGDENWLIWSPDGRRVAFNSFTRQHLALYQSSSTGEAARFDDLLIADDEGKWPVSWSPDGRSVLYVTNTPKNGNRGDNDIWVLPLDATRKPYPFLQTRFAENWAAFSPDGRWVAFSSTESGQPEVYVTSFPDRGRRWLVSSRGGSQARWRRDGGELYYLGLDGMLMSVEVDGRAADFAAEPAQPLFDIRVSHPPYHAYDVTADGQRFLVSSLVVSSGPGRVVALQSRQPPAVVGR